MSSLLPPHVSYVLTTRGRAIAAALVLVAALGGGAAAWTYTHPPTASVTDHVDRETVTTTLSTSAVASGDAGIYSPGTVLEDQPVYLVRSAPTVTLSLATTLPENAGARADQRLALVYVAKRSGDEFWRRTVPLAGATVRRGRVVTTTANVSARSVFERRRHFQSAFGDAATVSVRIAYAVDYQTDRYTGNLSKVAAVSGNDRWYAIPHATASKRNSKPVTRTVALDVTNRPSFYAPAGIGLVAFLLAGVVTALSSRSDSADDLAAGVAHARFADWISAGTVPDGSEPVVALDSLGDLVDVAIDTGERVIHDEDRGTYVVLHRGVRYTFTRSGSSNALSSFDW